MKQVKMEFIFNNKNIPCEYNNIEGIIKDITPGEFFCISKSEESFLQIVCMHNEGLGFFRIEKPCEKEGFILSSHSSRLSVIRALQKFFLNKEYKVIKCWNEEKLSEINLQEEIELFN